MDSDSSDHSSQEIAHGDAMHETEKLSVKEIYEGSTFDKESAAQTTGSWLASKYKILGKIGSGGSATLYEAEDAEHSRYAIKVLERNVLDATAVRRFQAEATAARKLKHLNLVPVLDFGESEGRPFLVMEFLEGESLISIIKSEGALKPSVAIEIAIQICEGLVVAHEAGIIHRDVKPGNVMVTKGGQIKLVDFGIAKITGDLGASAIITQSGEVFGSPAYMSPEQCKGKRVDLRSDIYSLGCTLFEMLTCSPPFVGSSTFSILLQHQESPAPSLKQATLGESFHPELERVVAKTLAKDPDDRYQSAHQLLDALKACLEPDKSPVSSEQISKLVDVERARTFANSPSSLSGSKGSKAEESRLAKEEHAPDFISRIQKNRKIHLVVLLVLFNLILLLAFVATHLQPNK